jgi:AcrR family transcriptional regulator
VTSELLRRQGFAATGVKQILAGSDARFSSLYHYFPGGKDALAAEAITHAGAVYQHLVEDVWDSAADLCASVAAVFAGAAAELEATDFADACPIATVALEVASTNETLRLATSQVFSAWIDSATSRLAHSGMSNDTAESLAQAIICLLEGAFVLARAAKSTDAMRAAGHAAIVLVQHALPDHQPTGRQPRRPTGRTSARERPETQNRARNIGRDPEPRRPSATDLKPATKDRSSRL